MEAFVVFPDSISPVNLVIIDDKSHRSSHMLDLQQSFELNEEVGPTMAVSTIPHLKVQLVETITNSTVDGDILQSDSVDATFDRFIRMLPCLVQLRFHPRIPAGFISKNHRLFLQKQ